MKTLIHVPIDFNKRHPERKEDEVFITNAEKDLFAKIGWKTKRVGRVAYSNDGKRVAEFPQFFPVFAKISEIKDSERGCEVLSRLHPDPLIC